jgi:hypothetical protein
VYLLSYLRWRLDLELNSNPLHASMIMMTALSVLLLFLEGKGAS